MKKIIIFLLALFLVPSAWAGCDEIGRLHILNTTEKTLLVSSVRSYDDSDFDGLSIGDKIAPHQDFDLLACKSSGLFVKRNASGEVEFSIDNDETLALSYEFFQDSYTDGQVDVRIKVRISNTNAYQVVVEKRRTWDKYKPIADVIIEAYQREK